MKKSVKYAGNNRFDQTIVKTCEVCKMKYHPRRNGYEMTSRFCSQECAKEGRKLFLG